MLEESFSFFESELGGTEADVEGCGIGILGVGGCGSAEKEVDESSVDDVNGGDAVDGSVELRFREVLEERESMLFDGWCDEEVCIMAGSKYPGPPGPLGVREPGVEAVDWMELA